MGFPKPEQLQASIRKEMWGFQASVFSATDGNLSMTRAHICLSDLAGLVPYCAVELLICDP